MTSHRRAAVLIAPLVLLMSVLIAGSASAHDNRLSTDRGTVTARTAPVPGLNRGESATFRIRDNGNTIRITGSARGMQRGTYVSLIYTDGACSQNVGFDGLTVDGAFQPHGRGSQWLVAEYRGADAAAVRGQIRSISIRSVDTVILANPAPATATLTPRACATLPRPV